MRLYAFHIHLLVAYITLWGLVAVCDSKIRNPIIKVPNALKDIYPKQRSGRLMPNPKVYRCGQVGSEMVVNFVNQHYPDDDIAAGECNFRLVIQSHDICQIRVDLVDTQLLAPSRGECLSQAFAIEGSIWPTGLPPLCGVNNDQHFYLQLQPWLANSSIVDFKLVSIIKGRPYRFGIWLTQIDCGILNVLRAPEGCTQYYLSESGTMKSFNHEGKRYLNGQSYQICIRPSRGVCGIKYSADPGNFRIKKSIQGPKEMLLRSGAGPTVCGTDYIMIPDGRDTVASVREKRLLFRRPPQKTQSPPVAISKRKFEVPSSQDRFCGGNLSPSSGDPINKPVFARVRSNMISLYFKTSPLQEFRGKAAEALNLTSGFFIRYTQLRNCEDIDSQSEMVLQPPLATQLHAMQFPLNTPPPGELMDSSGSSISSMTFSNGTKWGQTIDRGDVGDEDSIWEYLEEEEDEEPDIYDYFD